MTIKQKISGFAEALYASRSSFTEQWYSLCAGDLAELLDVKRPDKKEILPQLDLIFDYFLSLFDSTVTSSSSSDLKRELYSLQLIARLEVHGLVWLLDAFEDQVRRQIGAYECTDSEEEKILDKLHLVWRRFMPEVMRLKAKSIARQFTTALEEMRSMNRELESSQSLLIAEKERADQARREFEELFQRASDGLCTVDRSGRIGKYNPRFRQITGRRVRDLDEGKLSDILHLDERIPVAKRLEALFAGSEEQGCFLTRIVQPKGEVLEVEITTSYSPLGGMATLRFHDVTRQRQLEQLREVTHEICSALGRELKREKAYETVYNNLSRVTNFGRLSITLYNEETQEFRIDEAFGSFFPTVEVGLVFPASRTVLKEAIRSNTPLVWPDLAEAVRDGYIENRMLARGVAKSSVSIPLYVSGNFYGTLNVTSPRKHNFAEESIDLLGRIGTQLGTTLTLIEHYERETRRNATLSALQRINGIMAGKGTFVTRLEESLEVVLDTLDGVLDAALFLSDRRENVMECHTVTHNSVFGQAIEAEFPMMGGAIEEVFEKNRPSGFPDSKEILESSPPLSRKQQAVIASSLKEMQRELVLVPISDHKVRHGMLFLETQADGFRLDEGTEEFLQGFASQVATALKTGNLVREIETQTRYLRTVIDHTGDAVITVDSQMTVKSWNRTAREFFGISRRGAIGRDLRKLMRDYDPMRFRSSVRDVFSGVETGDFQFTVSRNGKERILRASFNPIPGKGREVTGALVRISDVTDSETLRSQLEKEIDEVEFLFQAATELNKPQDLLDKLDIIVSAVKRTGWTRVRLFLLNEKLEITHTAGDLKGESGRLWKYTPEWKARTEFFRRMQEMEKEGGCFLLRWSNPTYRKYLRESGESVSRSRKSGGGWHPNDGVCIPLPGRAGDWVGLVWVSDPVHPGKPPLENLKLLEIFCHQVAMIIEQYRLVNEIAVRDERRSQQIAMARSFQSQMIPRSFAQNHIEISTQFRAAQDLSGDFCDVIDFDRRTIGLTIGDVSNKGILAAIRAFRLHNLLHNFARVDTSPGALLETINDYLYSKARDEDWFITAFFAQIDTMDLRMRYARAGHELPLLRRADGEIMQLQCDGGVLGVFKENRFENREFQLGIGDKMILFTDGVCDAKNPAREIFGRQRLMEILEKEGHLPGPDLKNAIFHEVLRHGGDEPLTDDTLLVVMEVVSQPWRRFRLPSDTIGAIFEFIVREMKDSGADDESVYDVKTALNESIVNAIKFGNREVVDDFLKPVFVSIRLDKGLITVMVEDFGQGFDIETLPDPTLRSHLMRTDGRGLFLIRELMDSVEFNDQGNVITMVKKF